MCHYYPNWNDASDLQHITLTYLILSIETLFTPSIIYYNSRARLLSSEVMVMIKVNLPNLLIQWKEVSFGNSAKNGALKWE